MYVICWNVSIVIPYIFRILLNDILSSTQFPDNSIYEVIQATDIQFAENTILEVKKMNIEIREITRERERERERESERVYRKRQENCPKCWRENKF